MDQKLFQGLAPLPKTPMIAGAVLWIATLQFFVVQFIVQDAWTTPFSLSKNFISDLGAVHRGEFPPGSGSDIYSPAHAVMNTSFIVFGLMIAAGALLIGHSLKGQTTDRLFKRSIAAFVAAGCGVILVGLFPEDTVIAMHGLGALLQVFGSSIGFIFTGRLWRRHGFKTAGSLSVLTGIISPVAFIITSVISMLHTPFLGMYLGTWERIAIWPEPFWFMLTGAGLLLGCFSGKTDFFRATAGIK